MENNNGSDNPSTIDIVRENYRTLFSEKKTCPRCGTEMPASAALCPNCSAYTAGTTVPEAKRKVAASGKQLSGEQNKRTAAGCLIQFVIMAGIIALFVLVSYFPEDKRMYGVALIMAIVSGLIYLLAYWLIIKLYMKQIPQTERLNNADQFSGNFRMTDHQE